MEVEMLSRATKVYGRQLKNMDKVKEYADRVALLNPGEPALNSLYQMVNIDYDPTQYENKFGVKYLNTKQNEEIKPEEENIEEDIEPKVSISPNPANPRTTIQYTLPEASFVIIEIYSITGQKVETLTNTYISAGNHSTVFNGSHYGSGIYLYRFKTDNYLKTGKLLILK